MCVPPLPVAIGLTWLCGFSLTFRLYSDFAPLLKIVKLYPITMRRLDRLGWCIFVLALIWAARAAVAIAVGVEFCQMSNAAPETQPHKFKNADPHQEMYTFFTVTTPLHMSSLFAQVFYVMGIAGERRETRISLALIRNVIDLHAINFYTAILGSTSIRFFIASGRQKIRRGPRIARLVMVRSKQNHNIGNFSSSIALTKMPRATGTHTHDFYDCLADTSGDMVGLWPMHI